MDPFGREADISQITPRQDRPEEDYIDQSDVRIFVFMKDKPEIEEDVALPDMRPPWDINTNVKVAPKYLRSGAINPNRFRPASARACRHFKGTPILRPFSAPCGFSEFSSWKHPMDMQPYLSVSEMKNFRRYGSISDLKSTETNPLVREKATKLLSSRGKTVNG